MVEGVESYGLRVKEESARNKIFTPRSKDLMDHQLLSAVSARKTNAAGFHRRHGQVGHGRLKLVHKT
jgi:hypothetical protein